MNIYKVNPNYLRFVYVFVRMVASILLKYIDNNLIHFYDESFKKELD